MASITDLCFFIIPNCLILGWVGYAFTQCNAVMWFFGLCFLCLVCMCQFLAESFFKKKNLLGMGDIKCMFCIGLFLDPWEWSGFFFAKDV